MFYDNTEQLVRVVVVGLLAYVALIVFLRISGKRTLSRMNAFDLVVTVALGSTLATVLLSTDISLAEGALALALLIGMQYSIAWLAVRSTAIARFVKSEPALLVHEGRILEAALRRERVTISEIQAAVRAQGLSAPEDAFAVILETNGNFSVVPNPSQSTSNLPGVSGAGSSPRRPEEP